MAKTQNVPPGVYPIRGVMSVCHLLVEGRDAVENQAGDGEGTLGDGVCGEEIEVDGAEGDVGDDQDARLGLITRRDQIDADEGERSHQQDGADDQAFAAPQLAPDHFETQLSVNRGHANSTRPNRLEQCR